MTESWEQTTQISMSVQSAEVRRPGLTQKHYLALVCKLVSIARGTCQIDIMMSDANETGENQLEIRVDRRVMTAKLWLEPDLFHKIIADFLRGNSRAVGITLTLDEALAVSVAGDLQINEETSIGIVDAGFVFPLR